MFLYFIHKSWYLHKDIIPPITVAAEPERAISIFISIGKKSAKTTKTGINAVRIRVAMDRCL
nr:hypothetical protein [Clostridium paraputrificum]